MPRRLRRHRRLWCLPHHRRPRFNNPHTKRPGPVRFRRTRLGLHRKHRVYLDPVSVAPLPENYEDRLTGIFPECFERLRLFALDPYDIALSKIERNTTRDRDDVLHLSKVVPFDIETLQRRYHDELRVYLGNPEREDLTLKLWLEMITEAQTPGY